MNSPKPKPRPWRPESKWKPTKQERKHANNAFYNSKAWRDTRKLYLVRLKERVWQSAIDHVWNLPMAELELSDTQSAYLLSLDFIPCEQCVKLFCLDEYDTVREGKELDHIDPLNPLNALDSRDWGSPFDHDNLQFLCHTHHSKKSNRDKKIIQLKRYL